MCSVVSHCFNVEIPEDIGCWVYFTCFFYLYFFSEVFIRIFCELLNWVSVSLLLSFEEFFVANMHTHTKNLNIFWIPVLGILWTPNTCMFQSGLVFLKCLHRSFQFKSLSTFLSWIVLLVFYLKAHCQTRSHLDFMLLSRVLQFGVSH